MPELVTEFPETAAQSSARSIVGGDTAAMMRETLAKRRRVLETDLPEASKVLGGARRESGEQAAASASELETLAERHAKERAASRPSPVSAPPEPSPSRAFLDPPASVLGQIQTLIFGVGQLAQGFAGLRGNAIGGLTALKGALEGWQAGDAERVRTSLAQWRNHWEVIKQKHQDAIEAHRDLLADHRSTMDVALMRHKLLADQQNQKLLSAVAEKGDVRASLTALDQERAFLHQLSRDEEMLRRWDAREDHQQRRDRLASLSPEVKHHLAEVMHVDPLKATDAQLTEARRAADQKKVEDKERELRAHADIVEDVAIRREKRKEADAEKKSASKRQGALQDLGRLGNLIDRMNTKKLLPKSGSSLPAVMIAKLNRQWIQPTDPDFVAFSGIFGPIMIGEIDRSIFDEKGVRAIMAFRQQFDMLNKIPSAEAMHALLDELKGSIRDKMRETQTNGDPLGILR